MIHLSSFEMPNKKYVLPFLLLYNLCAPLHDFGGMYGSAWKPIEIRFKKFPILLICNSEPFPFPINAQRDFLEQKIVSFYEKLSSKNLATKKLLIKSFQKLFLGVLNVEQMYRNALFSIK